MQKVILTKTKIVGSISYSHFVFLLVATSVSAAQKQSEGEAKGVPYVVPDSVDLYAPPEPVPDTKLIFVEKNEKGENVRLKLERNEDGVLEPSKVKITDPEMAKLRSGNFVLQEDASQEDIDKLLSMGENPAASSSSSCPLPSYFSIVGDSNGAAVGGVDFHNTNRPSGTNTQWVVFDFYTEDYRGSNAHTPVVLRHEDTLHGWGAFFGQNSGSPDGCGTSSQFNTQIEGWVVYGSSNPNPPSGSAYWQSNVFPNTCGAELIDGPIYNGPYVQLPRYRMMVHAASSKWAAYEVLEYSTWAGWTTVTSWTDINTASQGPGAGWPFPPPPYDLSAQGIFIGSTDSFSNVPNWEINFSNVKCGWF